MKHDHVGRLSRAVRCGRTALESRPTSSVAKDFGFPSMTSPVSFSQFARSLTGETAFDVLAVAKRLKSTGKDVIELQIGDSPFATTRSALAAGIKAIQNGATHYCPSPGLPSFRETIARNYQK